jgi:hypothetical protein
MGKSFDFINKHAQWMNELLVSIYLPLLVIAAHESINQAWANRVLSFLVSRGFAGASNAIEDYRVNRVDFWLTWSSVFLLFLVLRLCRRLAFVQIVLRTVAGLLALVGLPLASMYAGSGHALSLQGGLLLGGASLILILWVYRKWRAPLILNILLLCAYFAVWASLLAAGSSLKRVASILIWPRWWDGAWQLSQYVWLTYPLLGICATLVWAVYFRRSEKNKIHVQ